MRQQRFPRRPWPARRWCCGPTAISGWPIPTIKNGVLMQYPGREEEVTIPDTCTSIGVRAFKDQMQLRRVVVPKSGKDLERAPLRATPHWSRSS